VIVTHARNAEGHRRVYLGGKSSLECWIEPNRDGHGWSFHVDRAVTGNAVTDADATTCVVYTLSRLCDELGVTPRDLANVPFATIAALHTVDPFCGRRIATGRRAAFKSGFMAAPPDMEAQDMPSSAARSRQAPMR
jgi:hypothetical protein